MACFCTTCGTPLVADTSRFCNKCGATVAASPDSSIAIPPPSVSRPGWSITKGVVVVAAAVGLMLLFMIVVAASKPSHLSFRGLQAGQSRAEVEAVLKKQNPNSSMVCDDPSSSHDYDCHRALTRPEKTDEWIAATNFHFYNGKLTGFYLSLRGAGSEDLFSTLREELTRSNHKDGTLEANGGGVFGELAASNGIKTFTWGTDRTVVCFSDQERDDCPAEKIELTRISEDSADVKFEDNFSETEGWAKKDKNRPKPKIAGKMTFMGIEGGEPRSQVDAALQGLHYSPLACKQEPDEVKLTCTTVSQGHQFEALWFVHGRLSSLRFRYPENERDALYQTFVKGFGEPTDHIGKKGAEVLFEWDSERTVPTLLDKEKQCPATSLMLTPHDGIVVFNYMPLVKVGIKDDSQRMIEAAHRN
ncbi:MAG: zinc ribbon domain-containing protein [Terriglobales bacterium]